MLLLLEKLLWCMSFVIAEKMMGGSRFSEGPDQALLEPPLALFLYDSQNAKDSGDFHPHPPLFPTEHQNII